MLDVVFTIHANVTVHMVDPDAQKAFKRLEDKVDGIKALQEQIMKTNEDIGGFLDQLDARTNQIAEKLTANTAVIQNISSDVDALLADSTLSESNRARMEAAKVQLDNVIASQGAQSQDLQNIAAKREDPLPAPVPQPEPIPTPTPGEPGTGTGGGGATEPGTGGTGGGGG